MTKYFHVFFNDLCLDRFLSQQLLIEFTYFMEVALSPHIIMLFVLQLAISKIYFCDGLIDENCDHCVS